MNRWVGPVVIALAGAIVFLSTESQDSRIYGYLLFSPATSVPSGAGEGTLRIDECRMTPKGLYVQGYVAPGDPPVEIGVAPADPTSAGLRVGVAFAAHAQRSAGMVPGDFRVVVPWATRDSRFAIIARGQWGSALESAEQGPRITCPPGES
jgi:hypothetical protein